VALDNCSHPLVVDLDGTLIHTDMLHESALSVFRDNPLDLFRIPFWLYQGKALLKRNLALQTDFNLQSLPYNEEFLVWLREQKSSGRRLVLCTASDVTIAKHIADYLQIFDEVIASDGSVNIAGGIKAEVLEKRFGYKGFDYAGNSKADLAVWCKARRATVVNASSYISKKAESICEVEKFFPVKVQGISVWRHALRVHQWLKNLLLFVPIIAAHQILHVDTWIALIFAFLSFSLCASSVYIANDLLDLESDRLHPRKRNRPFASGLLPVWKGVALAPLLLFISWMLGLYVGTSFLTCLAFYFILTCAYSLGLKRLVLVDCLALAILYTLRIITGAVAVGHLLSFWILAFSVFLFLSLAFVKRYAELEVQLLSGNEKIHGRGYHTSDATLIQTMGITSGYASVLVLALYLNSDAVVKLYQTPEFVWGGVPIMLFWISWMWLQAHRGNMHDDPLIFAIKDKASLFAGIAFAMVISISAVGSPW
jgi:4-hydroxybenzoate polyprenyltransferase